MKRSLLFVSSAALGLSPLLAQAGGEIVAPPPPPPQPVVVAPPQPEPVAPAPAPQPDRGGPYVSLFGGASWLTDSEFGFREDDDFFENDELDDVVGETNFDTGWVAGAAVGYTADIFGFQPRLELEGAYRRHDVDEFGFDFDGDDILADDEFGGGDGNLEVASGLVNAWFDVPVFGFRPYVGGGAGIAKVWANDISGNDTRLAGESFDDSDTAFAWQVGAGVGYDLTEDLTAFVDYRYFNVKDLSFGGEGDFEDDDLDVEYNTHNAMAGLRFTF